jgi:hypothetical protein
LLRPGKERHWVLEKKENLPNCQQWHLLTFLLDIYSMPLPFTAGIKKWNIDHFERQYPSPYDMNHGMDEILSRILYSIRSFGIF